MTIPTAPSHPDCRCALILFVARHFALGKYDVTFAEWSRCVVDGGCNGYIPPDEGWGRGRRPVINVSWSDANAYVQWLKHKTGQPYRLPSEAEWEYAARAGTSTPYWWGETITPGLANYNSRKTVMVGSYSPNPFGLYDTAGNIFQWVSDGWHENYEGAPANGREWRGAQAEPFRVLRGGAWKYGQGVARAACRGAANPASRSNVYGFRVAKTINN